MAFKIAVDAGHYLKTSGKRCLKKLDPNETREWVINDRIARYLIEASKLYENVETMRVDDPTGKKSVSLSKRCKAANNWGADMYISCHHDAGIKGGSGGGITAYSYKEGTKGAEYRDVIYDECIAAGGLVGNRYDPKLTASFEVLRDTDAPAVLVEYGFMDSKADVPVILTEAYGKAMGYATMAGIAKAAGLRKKVAEETKPAAPETAGETISVDLPVLKRGAKGEVVKAMQSMLDLRGFTCGDGGADGSFGPATEKQVKAFQASTKQEQTGICDLRTWSALLGLV